MRKTLSIVTAALVVAGLAACSSGASNASATPDANGCLNIQPGDTSKSIKVEGKLGATPKVTIPTPLKTKDIERSVVIKGDGAEVKGGDSIGIALAAYNGLTGKELTPAVGFDGQDPQTIQVNDKSYVPGLVRAVECLPLLSRVVLTATAKEAFGGRDISTLKIEPSDPVVFVVDLATKLQTRANGKSVTPPAGFPTVKLSSTGEPDITIPKSDPPTETKIGVLKQGDGDVVQPGDTVTVQYKGVLWRNGQTFDSSWSRGEPASFSTTGVVAGFKKALEGQKVGSQVIAIIPPADGYGAKGSGDIKATDTMVFVIDILGTAR